MTRAPAELIGTVLDGRFRIEDFVGEGEKGALVFRAKDLKTGAPVAVRCPGMPAMPTRIAYEQAIDTFLREAKVLSRISAASDDVEQLLAFGVAEPETLARLPFCVFEWLEGKSLADHLAERPGARSAVSEAIAILEPAARALAAVHALRLAHGDVRPQSLWLASKAGRLRMKVTQFVAASRIGEASDAFSPAYGAPEHFKPSYGRVGPETDVYGLALTLVELVSGHRALQGGDAGELYLATSNLGHRPTPRTLGAEVSDGIEEVFSRALAVNPRRRPRSAGELWEQLAVAVPDLAPRPAAVGPMPLPAPRRRFEGLIFVLWIVGTLLAAVGLAYGVIRLGRPKRR